MPQALRKHLTAALRSPLTPIWLVVFLLPFGRSSELGTLLCLLGAIVLFFRDRRALADKLEAAEATIIGELNGAQGKPVELGGYYRPDMDKVNAAMRPSQTFTAALQGLREAE
jgi:hypothetical protein